MHIKKITISLFAGMMSMFCNNVSAQPMKQYQDTPTPAEMAVHNQPYIILQKEIEKKICNDDWEIDTQNKNGDYVSPFLILNGDPLDDVIRRGTSVFSFMPVDRRIACDVKLKNTSGLYKTYIDSMQAKSAILQAQQELAFQLIAKAAKNNYKYTREDSAVLKKIKIIADKVNTELALLSNTYKLANISMQLNSHWTEPLKGRKYFFDAGMEFDAGKKLPPIEGAAYATLFMKNPWHLDPDTLCEATIYIGNWPAQPDITKIYPFHFVHVDKAPWTDKQHSGKPFVENMKIIITGENRERVMSVVHNIDYTKLEALVH